MTDDVSKSHQLLRRLGAAFVVTAAVPLSSIVANAATPPEKLSALRAAVHAGAVQLLTKSESGATADQTLQLAEGFNEGFTERAPEPEK